MDGSITITSGQLWRHSGALNGLDATLSGHWRFASCLVEQVFVSQSPLSLHLLSFPRNSSAARFCC